MYSTRLWFVLVVLLCGCAPDPVEPVEPAEPDEASTYRLVEDWASFPEGVEFGPVASVAHAPNGTMHVLRRGEPAFFTFDATGQFVGSWGEDIFDWSHGLRVDNDGFIWATDGRAHEVFKFSPEGEILLRLGQRGVGGDGPDTFNRPTDVVVAPNGDFFVTDGYVNSRVVKFSADGTFIKTWGTKGTEPGQFDLPHTIVMDSAGRLLVGDRENGRIQIFDQDGNFLDQWTDLGKPYGLIHRLGRHPVHGRRGDGNPARCGWQDRNASGDARRPGAIALGLDGSGRERLRGSSFRRGGRPEVCYSLGGRIQPICQTLNQFRDGALIPNQDPQLWCRDLAWD